MDFDTAFSILVDPAHEGGYVNNRQDPGGETKYGISKRSYPGVDIRNLTLEGAKTIYKADFWSQSGCEYVPDVAKFQCFEMGVNAGQKSARKAIQTAAGVFPDGIIGKDTLLAIGNMDPAWFYVRFCAAQQAYYTECTDWPTFGRGWIIRLTHNMLNARRPS